jgi:cell division protein FtsW
MLQGVGQATVGAKPADGAVPAAGAAAQRAAERRRALRLGIDVPMLVVVILMLVFGLLMVYSASTDYAFRIWRDPLYMISRQVRWFFVGLAGAGLLALMDYHYWKRLAVPLMGGTVIMLILVLFLGEERYSAVRTLWRGSIQPSELAKLAIILYLSVWLYAKREQLSNVSFGLVPLGVIIGALVGLILQQPDVSAAFTIVALGGLMFFLAGGDLKQIGVLLLIVALFGWLVVQIYPTGSERLNSYLAGFSDPLKASYHVQRSLEAFVRGGWLGVGVGLGETKLTGLPVPPTDSIFAVVGEETGFLGAGALVAAYLIFLWRGLAIARRAPDELGRLLASGLTLWLVLEAVINMAVMVNLMPIAGNALPFISAGGSSLVVSMAAVGILMNISRQADKRPEEDGRQVYASAGLRRRDRRRRVSRPGRSAGASAE